jgi:hypothetical protein
VIHVGIDGEGVRRVLQICKVNDRYENSNIEMENLFVWKEDVYVSGLGD